MELHHDPDAPTGATAVLAVDGHDVVAAVRVGDDAGGVVAVDVAAPERVGRAEARMLVEAAMTLTPRAGDAPRSLMVSDALVRFEARRVGCAGALRGLLSPPGAEVPDAPSFAGAMSAFLPRCEVRERRMWLRAPEVRVAPDGGGGRVRIRLPREDEVMAEPVAAAADTALAVKARFGKAARGIDALSFDHGGVGLATGDVSGLAEGASGVVVLTPNFVVPDLLERERRTRAQASRRTRPEPADAVPFGSLDEVVAHECWHYLDAEVRVSGTDYVAFNAALGEALGVASLELALRGRERGAPPEWQVAHARLVEEVSAYAATNPREATAEMFSLWWCGRGGSSAVVATFGELVERVFPRVEPG
ncbi:MAG: hypothetical protein ACHQIG_03185 [Acidimicrobiia bacterium]